MTNSVRRAPDGRRESLEAYTFDVFTRLLTEPAADNGKHPTLRNLMLVRVDLEALTRGTVEGDETCEIAGLGPIPVTSGPRDALGESILKLTDQCRGAATFPGRGEALLRDLAGAGLRSSSRSSGR